MLSAAEFSLSIEERFINNPAMVRKEQSTTFEWFNKHGSDNAGIDVLIHMRDSSGSVVNPVLRKLPLRTELVYDDGTPVPIMPLKPLRDKKGSQNRALKLYRPLRPDPVLGTGKKSSQFFSFRIEEVSLHHQNHKGFKLKVSPADFSHASNILPGLLEETIVVRSKSNGHPNVTGQRAGRVLTTFVPIVSTGAHPKRKRPAQAGTSPAFDQCGPKLPRRVSVTNETLRQAREKICHLVPGIREDLAVLTVERLCEAFLLPGRIASCMLCRMKMETSHSMLILSNHRSFCRFSQSILPNVTFVDCSSSSLGSAGSSSSMSSRSQKELPFPNNMSQRTKSHPPHDAELSSFLASSNKLQNSITEQINSHVSNADIQQSGGSYRASYAGNTSKLAKKESLNPVEFLGGGSTSLENRSITNSQVPNFIHVPSLPIMDKFQGHQEEPHLDDFEPLDLTTALKEDLGLICAEDMPFEWIAPLLAMDSSE